MRGYPGARRASDDFPHSAPQPWLVGILSFHVILWLLVIAVRRNNTAQMVVLTATCALVYSSQYANSYAAVHWRALGFTQNYFDEQGVFVSFVFSAPLLVLAFCQVCDAGYGEVPWHASRPLLGCLRRCFTLCALRLSSS